MNRLFRETCISIRTSVLICFILMIAAMILPAVQCAYHLGGHDGEGGKARLTGTDTAPGDAHGTGPDNRDRPDARITDIRNQLFMGVLAALACAIGVFLFLMKTVVVPVRRLADGTRILADGRLDVAVPPGPRNDIGRIGFAVNELAVNLQEVLLHAWNHTIRVTALLGPISETLSDNPPHGPPRGVDKNVEDILLEIKELQTLIRAFDFFDIQIEDGRILAAELRDSHRPDEGRPMIGREARPMNWDLENSN